MGVLAAAVLAREVVKVGRGCEKRARRCIQLGEEGLKAGEKTVTFAHAVQKALEERKERRPRTLSDFRYIARRFMKRCPGLAERRIRSISAADCREYLQQAFDKPRQRYKAHAILSGIFRSAMQQGWCTTNPIYNVEKPRVSEKEIRTLTNEEATRLMETAQRYKGGICLAAVSLMLYAGVRPHEVARLSWSDISLTHDCICIQPRHSKTGGARRVTIHPPLKRILMDCISTGKICPAQWQQHWRQLHKEAQFTLWQPDILRHTFASQHIAQFRSYAMLQLEMGHRSAELLRTRYVSATTEDLRLFC